MKVPIRKNAPKKNKFESNEITQSNSMVDINTLLVSYDKLLSTGKSGSLLIVHESFLASDIHDKQPITPMRFPSNDAVAMGNDIIIDIYIVKMLVILYHNIAEADIEVLNGGGDLKFISKKNQKKTKMFNLFV